VARAPPDIGLFEKLVLDDKTYELKGDRSIHRVLAGAMWLVDERNWLMSSNRTLRTLIGRAIQKERRDAATGLCLRPARPAGRDHRDQGDPCIV
jgi:hypothetical protein